MQVRPAIEVGLLDRTVRTDKPDYASADRTSSGCRAGATYTFFDECLMGSLYQGRNWDRLFKASVACVREQERLGSYLPSEPQEWLGPAVADMPLPKGPPGTR